jgi:outer membrane protein assembly factor BamE (lipoprotein component of BamABCDE complex)
MQRAAAGLAALFAMLLSLEGCFVFRARPDPRAQALASQLTPGMTQEEVLLAVGPPQRRGQNLFDKRKEYWIYEFAAEPSQKKRRDDEAAPATELQLMFERGKLANWSVVSRR